MAQNSSNSEGKLPVPDIRTTPMKPRRSSFSPGSPGFSDFMVYPWKWGETAQSVTLSPGSSVEGSPPGRGARHDATRRGRPRADSITQLIQEGQMAPSGIRCQTCHRTFPREKSLQAHLRTHTGERPYRCDYPDCNKAFVQSGQLKTHQRLHTGEKPFVCNVPGCNSRFTHANRHCAEHPYAGLRREQTPTLDLKVKDAENNKAVAEWLARYIAARQEDKTPSKQKDQESRQPPEAPQKSTTDETERKQARVAARRRIQEQRDKWYGALALVELADNLMQQDSAKSEEDEYQYVEKRDAQVQTGEQQQNHPYYIPL
ncbi:zinc finger protein 367-like [Branchiostoma floridae x Branchiostoma belcheri]|nr:hypothetical protein Bbelb_121810 [Branchiostoma belcheri]